MKTQTSTVYHVNYEGFHGHFSQDGWSGYNDRWKAREAGLLKDEQVYGYEQALAHIEELRESWYNGKQQNKDLNFQIEIVSTAVTTIPIPKP